MGKVRWKPTEMASSEVRSNRLSLPTTPHNSGSTARAEVCPLFERMEHSLALVG